MQFVDLNSSTRLIREKLDARIANIIDSGQFILGPDVHELESQLSQYVGVKHCITCANGTDALMMALMAIDISPGDVIFCTAFSFFASAEIIPLLGAIPWFVDVDEGTFNLSPNKLKQAIEACRESNIGPPKAVVVADIFGLVADYESIKQICEEEDISLIEDAAQSFGASTQSQKACSFANIATTSFFPAKPLGCFGDGGALFTDDQEIADRLRSIRVHGKGQNKYDNVRIGMNSRLDTIQAGILLEKLTLIDEERRKRNANAQIFRNELTACFQFQNIPDESETAMAAFAILMEPGKRKAVEDRLHQHQIPSQRYYPMPLNKCPPMRKYPSDGCYTAESISQSIICIPVHAYLSEKEIDKIIVCLNNS